MILVFVQPSNPRASVFCFVFSVSDSSTTSRSTPLNLKLALAGSNLAWYPLKEKRDSGDVMIIIFQFAGSLAQRHGHFETYKQKNENKKRQAAAIGDTYTLKKPFFVSHSDISYPIPPGCLL